MHKKLAVETSYIVAVLGQARDTSFAELQPNQGWISYT